VYIFKAFKVDANKNNTNEGETRGRKEEIKKVQYLKIYKLLIIYFVLFFFYKRTTVE
jgi:hypothetical protein